MVVQRGRDLADAFDAQIREIAAHLRGGGAEIAERVIDAANDARGGAGHAGLLGALAQPGLELAFAPSGFGLLGDVEQHADQPRPRVARHERCDPLHLADAAVGAHDPVFGVERAPRSGGVLVESPHARAVVGMDQGPPALRGRFELIRRARDDGMRHVAPPQGAGVHVLFVHADARRVRRQIEPGMQQIERLDALLALGDVGFDGHEPIDFAIGVEQRFDAHAHPVGPAVLGVVHEFAGDAVPRPQRGADAPHFAGIGTRALQQRSGRGADRVGGCIAGQQREARIHPFDDPADVGDHDTLGRGFGDARQAPDAVPGGPQGEVGAVRDPVDSGARRGGEQVVELGEPDQAHRIEHR